jgi:hypothetical protein
VAPGLVRQAADGAVPDLARRTVVDEQAGLVAPVGGPLRDELGREVVVELVRAHVRATR